MKRLWLVAGIILPLICPSMESQYSAEQLLLYEQYVRSAARTGDAAYIATALQAGVRVDAQDINGFSALHWAARYVKLPVVQVLLSAGANVTLTTGTGETPLMSAIMGSYQDMSPSKALSSQIVEMILSNGSYIDAQDNAGNTALNMAARLGNLNLVSYFLQNNADVTKKTVDGETAFYWAALTNSVPIQRVLADRGADINTQDNEGNTPLIWAARQGHLETVQFLISRAVQANLPSNTGDTAIMWAGYYNRLEMARELLNYGSNVDQQDESGWTALMGAAAQGHAEMVELLLTYNATAGLENTLGHTALTLSSAVGETDVTDLLSEAMLPLMNQQDSTGRTPLIYAANNNYTVVFIVLAYKCPDITLRDSENRSVMDYARMSNNTRMVELLEIMADPYCLRFKMRYEELAIVHQDCEVLQCHCTGAWKFTGDKDPTCGKGKSQVVAVQRRRVGGKETNKLLSYIVK